MLDDCAGMEEEQRVRGFLPLKRRAEASPKRSSGKHHKRDLGRRLLKYKCWPKAFVTDIAVWDIKTEEEVFTWGLHEG